MATDRPVMGGPGNMPGPPGGNMPIPVRNSESIRFEVELEFVQCLANPNYLNFLAQRGYFKHKDFVNYLKYLLYWKQPNYAKYLRYPQCLYMLELLQYEDFRKELVNTPCAKFIEDQMLLHWQYYTRKRIRLQQAVTEANQKIKTEEGMKDIKTEPRTGPESMGF